MATILLIDDDVDLMEVNRTVLARRGHAVRAAYSAREARAALEQGPVDAAVIDIMMETNSAGFDLAREIRRAQPHLPTVVLTGMRKILDLKCDSAPDEDWLPVMKVLEKPVSPAQLADEVEALLAERPRGAPPQSAR